MEFKLDDDTTIVVHSATVPEGVPPEAMAELLRGVALADVGVKLAARMSSIVVDFETAEEIASALERDNPELADELRRQVSQQRELAAS